MQLCSPREASSEVKPVAPATSPDVDLLFRSSLRDAHAKEQTPRTASGEGQPQHGSLPIPLLAVGGRSDGLLEACLAAGKEWAEVAHI